MRSPWTAYVAARSATIVWQGTAELLVAVAVVAGTIRWSWMEYKAFYRQEKRIRNRKWGETKCLIAMSSLFKFR